jgi:hypothetical protein
MHPYLGWATFRLGATDIAGLVSGSKVSRRLRHSAELAELQASSNCTLVVNRSIVVALTAADLACPGQLDRF